MDFTLSEEQAQFATSMRRWVEKDYSFEQRKHIITSDNGISDSAWTALTELGALALPIPEEQGGFNGSAVDMLAIMQELGRGLVIEPYFATVMAAEFLKLAGGNQAILEKIALGELKLACALTEKQSRYDLFDLTTKAIKNQDGYCLTGVKTVVLHGAQADKIIIVARSNGAQRDTDGISLFICDLNAAGISYRDYRTVDGFRAADITLSQVQVPSSNLLGAEGKGWEILDAASDYGICLVCAEAVGVMEVIFDATLEYMKTRQQFGVPIGKFQALQHRMADMFMELEQARSLATLAAVKVSASDIEERRRTISAAKVRIGQAARFIGQQAVQLHGGMGVTNELPAAHMFKRLTMIEYILGDTDHHLARFVEQPGFKTAA